MQTQYSNVARDDRNVETEMGSCTICTVGKLDLKHKQFLVQPYH